MDTKTSIEGIKNQIVRDLENEFGAHRTPRFARTLNSLIDEAAHEAKIAERQRILRELQAEIDLIREVNMDDQTRATIAGLRLAMNLIDSRLTVSNPIIEAVVLDIDGERVTFERRPF